MKGFLPLIELSFELLEFKSFNSIFLEMFSEGSSKSSCRDFKKKQH